MPSLYAMCKVTYYKYKGCCLGSLINLNPLFAGIILLLLFHICQLVCQVNLYHYIMISDQKQLYRKIYFPIIYLYHSYLKSKHFVECQQRIFQEESAQLRTNVFFVCQQNKRLKQNFFLNKENSEQTVFCLILSMRSCCLAFLEPQ